MQIGLNATTIEVVDEGSGEAILFLHGMGCDGTDWRPQIDALSDSYRCVAIDHRGHGRSDRLVGDGFSIPGFAADALAVLDHLGIDRAHVVGLSMGGMIAQQIALDAPDRVVTLTLMDTFASPGAMGAQMGGMADMVEQSDDLEAFAGGFEAMVFASGTVSAKPAVIERFRTQFRANTPACLAGDMRAIAGFDVTARLAEIGVPTLVLCGAEDNLTPLPQAEEIAAGIPGARLEIVPEAGHFSNIENPTVVNDLLTKHLATGG